MRVDPKLELSSKKEFGLFYAYVSISYRLSFNDYHATVVPIC